MATLFLIRHGLTAVTGKTLYGRTPGISLDDRGRAQADRLSERFAPVRLSAIYSSPLARCTETLAPLAARQRLEVRTEDGLTEMDAGAWTNRSLAQLRRTRLWRVVMEHPSQFRFPDGEAFAEALTRALTTVQAIVARHPRGRIAVGTHGDIVRMLVTHYAGAHLDLFQRNASDPGSVSVVLLGDGSPRLLLVNDTGGLERFGPTRREKPNLRG
jgi:probable phosphoglycerate mutase